MITSSWEGQKMALEEVFEDQVGFREIRMRGEYSRQDAKEKQVSGSEKEAQCSCLAGAQVAERVLRVTRLEREGVFAEVENLP